MTQPQILDFVENLLDPDHRFKENDAILLKDGVYGLDDDIEIFGGQKYFRFQGKGGLGVSDFYTEFSKEELIAFLNKHPDFVYAEPYQTNYIWFLSRRPNQLEYTGNGFNYGSSNLIINCPKRVLVLAEDD